MNDICPTCQQPIEPGALVVDIVWNGDIVQHLACANQQEQDKAQAATV